MYEDRIDVTFAQPGMALAFVASPACDLPYREVTDKMLTMRFKGRLDEGYDYALRLEKGRFTEKEGTITVLPEDGRITFLPFNALR